MAATMALAAGIQRVTNVFFIFVFFLFIAAKLPHVRPKGNGKSCFVHGIFCGEQRLQPAADPPAMRCLHGSSRLWHTPPQADHHLMPENPMASRSSSWCPLFTATIPLLACLVAIRSLSSPAAEPSSPTVVVRPAAELRLPSDSKQYAIDSNMPAHWDGDTLFVFTSG
ncbi:MAG: hypothetical protein ACKO6B_05720, partial [Planctomycetia bacterium]